MLNGLAIWHYPHRSMVDNIDFFAAMGLPSVSVHGAQFARALADPAVALALADAVREGGVVFTVHYALPKNHGEDAVAAFRAGLDAIAAWQSRHGLISVLSFDVPGPLREGAGIGAYLDLVLERVPACRVAVEDFGLNAAERAQISHLRGNERFGYLVDLGHMLIRMRGQNTSGKPLFTNTPDEHPPIDAPDSTAITEALGRKDFPIFEMHLHNNDGVNDLHWFLEDGVFDIPAVAAALKALHYDGILTVESAPGFRFECRGTAADEGIRRTLAYWEACCRA